MGKETLSFPQVYPQIGKGQHEHAQILSFDSIVLKSYER